MWTAGCCRGATAFRYYQGAGRPDSVHFPALAGPGFHYFFCKGCGPFSCCSARPAPCQAEASLGGGTRQRVRRTHKRTRFGYYGMRASERADEVASIDGLNLVTWLGATTRLNPCESGRIDSIDALRNRTTRNATLAQKHGRQDRVSSRCFVAVSANDDRLRSSSHAYEALSEGSDLARAK